MNIPGLRLESLDIQLSTGLLFQDLPERQRDTPTSLKRPKPRVPGRGSAQRQRISVKKLVVRETVGVTSISSSRPWIVTHRTALGRALDNYRDIQELVLDFQLPYRAQDLADGQHVFPEITPFRLDQCTKLTFRCVPWTNESTAAHGVFVSHQSYTMQKTVSDDLSYLQETLIGVVVDRFEDLEHIKMVFRTANPKEQPPYPRLKTDCMPTRERLEAFTHQEALVLPKLQSVECMYVDRLRPLDPPVVHFLARVERAPSGEPRVQVEKSYWNPIRMSGFAENGAQLHLDLLSGANTAVNSEYAQSRAPLERDTTSSDDSRSTSQEV